MNTKFLLKYRKAKVFNMGLRGIELPHARCKRAQHGSVWPHIALYEFLLNNRAPELLSFKKMHKIFNAFSNNHHFELGCLGFA